MSHYSHEPQITVLPPNKEKIRHLWKVAGIMAVVTIFEFVIAFTMTAGPVKTGIFVLMTIVKAGYIVGEFMHLRYEVKLLFWSILVPMAFVLWMLVAFVYEGFAIELIRN